MISPGTPIPESGVYDGKGEAPLPVFFTGPALLVFFHADSPRSVEMLRWAETVNRFRFLTVIGVSQETIEATATMLQSAHIRLPMVIDDRPHPASQAFGFTTVPAAALIEDDLVSWASDGCEPSEILTLAGHLGRLSGGSKIETPVPFSAAPDPSRHVA